METHYYFRTPELSEAVFSDAKGNWFSIIKDKVTFDLKYCVPRRKHFDVILKTNFFLVALDNISIFENVETFCTRNSKSTKIGTLVLCRRKFNDDLGYEERNLPQRRKNRGDCCVERKHFTIQGFEDDGYVLLPLFQN